MKHAVPLLAAAGALLAATPVYALTAREIMERVDARDDGDAMTASQVMTLTDRFGHDRVRHLQVFTKDRDKDTHRMSFFLSPADVKDTGFLTLDYYAGDKDDDQWLYLPELHKTKRIASSDKSTSFMGTDFSYADLTRRVLDEWTYKLLSEQEVRGEPVWLIEATPVSEEIEDRYGYTKSVVFVRQDLFMAIRAIHWLSKGKKLKYMDVRKVELIDGIWFGTERHMKTTKGKHTLHETLLQFDNVKFNQDVDEDLFTVRRLEQGL